MRYSGRKKFVLMLLLLLSMLCIRIPVYAATLTGGMDGKTAGQTSVTARIELAEDYESGSFREDGKWIHTGDDTQVLTYVFMILFSGVVITWIVLRKNKRK